MTTRTLSPFHLAIPVRDLRTARSFYTEIIGCTTGRESEIWVDLNFYGHQLVLHESKDYVAESTHNPVDGEQVPVPHFGVVLLQEDWKDLADRLISNGQEFVIEPCVRFEGEAGEQSTMFFLDPSENALEFKAFKNPDRLFAS